MNPANCPSHSPPPQPRLGVPALHRLHPRQSPLPLAGTELAPPAQDPVLKNRDSIFGRDARQNRLMVAWTNCATGALFAVTVNWHFWNGARKAAK